MSRYAKLSLTAAAALILSTGGSWAQGNVTSPNAPYSASDSYDGQTYNNDRNNMNDNDGTMNGNTMNRGYMSDTNRSPSSIEPQAGNPGSYISRNPQSLNASDVRNVQESLRARGYNIAVDGIWGNQSASALRNFQQNSGLSNMGILDADTQAALNLSLNAGNNY